MKKFLKWTGIALATAVIIAALWINFDFPPGTQKWAQGIWGQAVAETPKPASVTPAPPAKRSEQLFPLAEQETKVAQATPPPKPEPVAALPAKPPTKTVKGVEGKKASPRPRSKPSVAATPAAATTAPAETPWGRWNVAPYATSFEEACRKASSAIDGFNMPAAVKEGFKQMLGADCRNGKEVWLVPHQRLEAMWSGGAKPHVVQNLTVGELPVLRSPDGRPYRKGSVAETAKALSWTFVHEGKTYVMYLPYVCFNWSWAYGPTVAVAKAPVCVTVDYDVEPGDQIWGAVFAKYRLPASECWEFTDGDRRSALPSACLDCDWVGQREYIPSDRQPLHTWHYIAQSRKQRLRFPVEVRDAYLVLCAFRKEKGQANGWVTRPEDWRNNTSFRMGPEKFPTWGSELHGKEFR